MALGQWLMLRLLQLGTTEQMLAIIISTAIVAFAGYIINDYFDFEIDAVNRPGRNLFLRKFFQQKGLAFYAVLNLLALVFAFSVNSYLLWLNFICAALLFVYSKWLKKAPFAGNLVVALMQAAVFLPVLIFDENSLSISGSKEAVWSFNEVFYWFILFFAFLTGWLREWVKDIEDSEGDKLAEAKTAAIMLPLKSSRLILSVLSVIVIVGVAAFTFALLNKTFYHTGGVLNYYYLFLMLPISIRSLVMLLRAQEKNDWYKLSTWLKIVMLAGVMSIGIV